MDEERYWYLAQGPEDDPEEKMNVLSVPAWPEALRWEDEDGMQAPMLFTDREAAERQRRELGDPGPDEYLEVVNALSEDIANEAFDNALPYRVYSLPREWLLLKLEDANYVEWLLVDEELKRRADLMGELRRG